MAAILGLGMTHVPLLAGRDQDMSRILRRVLQDPDLPERLRTPDGWPEPMRREWGNDEGLASARRHREALLAWCRKHLPRAVKTTENILKSVLTEHVKETGEVPDGAEVSGGSEKFFVR